MTNSSPTAASSSEKGFGLVRALIILAALTCALLVLWELLSSQANPYAKATLNLKGSNENGERLFRMNCAGCHGISAQGLVGPDLHSVTKHHSDSELIQQVVSGKTPPMPSFQLDPQAMADLLAHMHTLN